MNHIHWHREANAFFESGTTRPLAYRTAQLRRLLHAVENRERELLRAIHEDLRKSETDAYTAEIGFVAGDVRYALRHLPRWIRSHKRHTPAGLWPGRSAVRPEPFGVALIIGPWNYPFQLLFSPLVSALAAGNCACLKPSELAPHTSACVAALVRETFPPEYVTVAEGARAEAEALLGLPFDHVFFTGSAAVGRKVMAAAAQHLTPVTLELGGKCPCIVCADTDVTVAARRIAWGKFLNAGQTCVAPDFVLVDRRIRDAFADALRTAVEQFYGASPRTSPDYGRVVSRPHLDRLVAYLDAGRVAWGGDHDADDLYLGPTLLLDPPPDSDVMQEEIFGPVLPMVVFDELDDAIPQLRSLPTPLALYLFTRSRDVQERVLSRVRSGGVCINDVVSHIIGRDLPFGGLGQSGMGAYHGKAGFDTFTHERSVTRRGLRPDPASRYPPSRVPLRTIKRVQRLLLGS